MAAEARRRGAALIFSLIMVFITGIVIMSLLGVAAYQTRAAQRHEVRPEEFAGAEMALNSAYAELRFFLEYGTGDIASAVASIQPPSIPSITFPSEDYEITFVSSGDEVIVSFWTSLPPTVSEN